MTPSPQLFSLGARAGFLHPLTNGDNGTAPTPSDRFQLGGPTNLRMFRANSLGPRDGGAPFFSFFRLPTFTKITWLHPSLFLLRNYSRLAGRRFVLGCGSEPHHASPK